MERMTQTRPVIPEARSAELFPRAQAVLPGGVNSPVRAMRSIGRQPIFMAAGDGPLIEDVDGRRYVDYVCSWGPLIAGHAYPAIIRAVVAAAARGTSFGAPTPGEVALAEEVVDRIPGAEMIRMTSSGTEATMSAIRLARAATGRDPILKFAGAYHGHVDGLLADAGSGLATQGIPASPGVTQAQANDTAIVPWNDREAVERALEERPPAAIIAEPYPANMGLVLPDDGFLRFLREAADRSGALLIFDEVITGFRVSRGGAQEREGVTPDLTVLGKVIGGGLPAAAYAGPRELMERIAPVGDVYQAGTLSGNPLAVAAGLATLRLLDDSAYERLAETTATLAIGLAEAAGERSVPVQIAAVPGLFTVFFSETPVRNYEDAKRCDTGRYGAFCRALIERGVYPPASQFEAWFPSLVHDDEHVAHTLTVATEAFAEVA
jgi:glutamate-1-semialdehyde 2,1-aminomutase